ncbi:MAG: Bacterial cell division rane protein [Moraxellaceae bacterium]|jgi:cell division protein FtsW|nr:Bacterial cell division rane protein [Moraxellaceae bacterium]
MKALSLPTFTIANPLQGVTSRQLLLLAAGTLFCIGLVMVASASMGVAQKQFGGPFYFFARHLVYMVIGFTAGLFALRVPVEAWHRLSWLLLAAAFLLLIAVLVPGIGRRINGSMRWIGVGPMTLQPSEFAKFAVVAFVSSYLVRRINEVRTHWMGFLKPMLVVGLVVLLLLAEPDFGASMVTMTAVLGMLFLAGTPLGPYAVLLSIVVIGGGLLVWLEPYRLQRVLSFTDPWAHAYDSGYQLTQSLIAFGRGEWFGVGLGKSVQKLFYLPEAHTDFVLAVFAEEFGFVGVLLLITMFWVLVRSALRIGQQAELREAFYGAYMAYGIAIILGMQALVNIGVNMGLFPTKGLTLPLVSYGGSSLVIVFIMLGVLLRIDSENTAAAPAAKGGRA